MNLRDLQQTFKRSILEECDDLVPQIKTFKDIDPAARLDVYRNTVFVSLKQVLVDHFPALTHLVDVKFMRFICHQFIKAHPPEKGWLIDYGAALPDFLTTHPACTDYPYLADVARLEWALHEVSHAADSTPVDVAHITEKTDILLVPSVRLVRAPYAIYHLWEAAMGMRSDIPNVTAAHNVLVYRTAGTGEPAMQLVSDATAAVLTALRNGESLHQALAVGFSVDEKLDTQRLLVALLEQELLMERKTS